MKSVLSQIDKLREAGKHEEARAILLDLDSKNPTNSNIALQCAITHDNLGLEAEAISFYERAIELGLPTQDLQNAILGLGSSYRCLKKYEKSLEVLEDGVQRFPNNWSIKVFLAMTCYECGHHGKAMELLLNCLAETSADQTIHDYKRAIGFYAQMFGKAIQVPGFLQIADTPKDTFDDFCSEEERIFNDSDRRQ
jgi:tetratricopeptide (TPR) repeat protein